jgi:peptidoglycan-associated lipoprotein
MKFMLKQRVEFGWSLALVLLLAGCQSSMSQTGTRSSEDTRPAWTVENPSATSPHQVAQKGTPPELREHNSSSLEALREGRSSATPDSSPLKEIHFDFDRYDLRADARETLRANAQWMKDNPLARVEIEGHCDERGTNEYNLALGARRAQSARDYLVSLGIPAERLSTISYGEEIPVCRENTDECWQKNRRARLVIMPVRPTS